MPQSKERHAEWMRRRRGAQTGKVHREGARDWETVSIKDIKEALPDNIVEDIIVLGEYDRIRERSITLEGRFRRAYKYQVRHEANFINGIHKDLEATR